MLACCAHSPAASLIRDINPYSFNRASAACCTDYISPVFRAIFSLIYFCSSKKSNPSIDLLKEAGNTHYRDCRYEDALRVYREGLESTACRPSSISLWKTQFDLRSNIIQTLSQLGRLDGDEHKSLLGMIISTEWNPANIEFSKLVKALYRCARVYMNRGQMEEALNCLRCCLTYDPRNEVVQKSIFDIQMKFLSKLHDAKVLTLSTPPHRSAENCTLCSELLHGKQSCTMHCKYAYHPECLLRWMNEKGPEVKRHCGRELSSLLHLSLAKSVGVGD